MATLAQKDLLTRLREVFRKKADGKRGESLCEYLLDRYVSSGDIKQLACTCKALKLLATCMLWRVVNLKLDAMWKPPVHNSSRLVAWLTQLQSNRGRLVESQLIQEINIGDDVLEDDVAPQPDPLLLRQSLNSLAYALSLTVNLRIFRWESLTVPISSAILSRLAYMSPFLVRFEWNINPRWVTPSLLGLRRAEIYPATSKEESSYLTGKDDAALVSNQGFQGLGAPAKIHCTEMLVTLEGATPAAILSLTHILQHRFTRVKVLRVAGVPNQGKWPAVDEPILAINRTRNLVVEELELVNLRSEARYVTEAIDPGAMDQLDLMRCRNLPEILWPLSRQTSNLRAFQYYSPPEDAMVGMTDSQALFDFVRFSNAGLRALVLVGNFSEGPDTHGDAAAEHLFAAVQHQMPFLKELTVLNGEHTEFTDSNLRGLGSAAKLLKHLHLRATAAQTESPPAGLLSSLLQILPLFRELEALMFLQTKRNAGRQTQREHDTALEIASEAAKKIPLRLVGYDEPGKRTHKATYYRIQRPTDPYQPDVTRPDIPTIERVHEINDLRFCEVMGLMTKYGVDIGIPTVGSKVNRWGQRWWTRR